MSDKKIEEFLREDIKLVLLASVSEDYVDAILEQKDTVRQNTLIDAVAEDVTVSSDLKNKGYYNNDDIRLAIGRELVTRLGA